MISKEPGSPIGASSSKRIVGLDVARGIAICGMALIHFTLVLSSEQLETSSLGGTFNWLTGRPATIFMILAGIGVSLRFDRYGQPPVVERNVARFRLLKRGLFFLVFGFVNLLLWPGDILRVYGIAYILAAFLISTSGRWLAAMAFATFAVFVTMVFTIDFETNWDFATLHYSNLWTCGGSALNLFYNGFRAVFPWVGLLFVGMLLGRLDLQSKRVRQRLIYCGLLVWLVTEAISWGLLSAVRPLVNADEWEIVVALLGTNSLPAMPLFLLSSGGLAVVIIFVCVQLTEAGDKRFWQPMVSAGQMAFTWYIAHLVIVLSAGILTRFTGDIPLFYTFVVSLLFCDLMFGVSWLYRRRFRFGPLEWVLRSVA